MARYRVLIKPSAVKELEAIPIKKTRQRIASSIRKAENPRPRGCEKLSALDRYRIRRGWYRGVYSIDDDERTVLVVKVGHRKDVYR